MAAKEIIDKLVKFRRVDKYTSFEEIEPAITHAPEDQRAIVTEILDNSAGVLLQIVSESKRPSKPLLKKVLIECMDDLALAKIDTVNREFGYKLGWYLAEKVEVNLRKGTEKKVWGYWQVEANEVKIPVRPRSSAKLKAGTTSA